MIAKYVQLGDSIDYRPTTDVAAGDLVIVGEIVGVAKLDIPANTLGALALTGIYDIAKISVTITQGEIVYWDASNKKITNIATDNTAVGVCVLTSDATAETARIRIGG